MTGSFFGIASVLVWVVKAAFSNSAVNVRTPSSDSVDSLVTSEVASAVSVSVWVASFLQAHVAVTDLLSSAHL